MAGYDFIFIGSPLHSGSLAAPVKECLGLIQASSGRKMAGFITHFSPAYPEQDMDGFTEPIKAACKEKGVDICGNCDDFPCAFLAPTADGAAQYPHNMKVYNLCRIKTVGIEQWIAEAGQIRKKYFTGKFVAGKGQAF